MLAFLALSGYFKEFLHRYMSKLSKNLIELNIPNKCFICNINYKKLVKETIRKFRKKYSQD